MASQKKASSEGRGGRRYMPYAFTEQGISMLSSILRSDVALKYVRILPSKRRNLPEISFFELNMSKRPKYNSPGAVLIFMKAVRKYIFLTGFEW